MIYLFNSAIRENYEQNIMRTLFLPKGWTNVYKYRINGENPLIDKKVLKYFLKSKRKNVVIVFIDRYSKEGYKFYPIRKGKIEKCYKEGEKIFFSIKLLDYTFTEDTFEFNNNMKKIKGIPKLTNNNPDNGNDGFYVIKDKDYSKNKTINGDIAWEQITEILKETRAFESKTDRDVVFARLKLLNNSKICNNKTPIIKLNETYYRLMKNKKYQFKLFYKYPNQDNGKTSNLELKNYEPINLISSNKIKIDCLTNNIDIDFETRRYIEDKRDKIEFKFTPANKNEKILAPDITIVLKFNEGIWFWLKILIALFLLGIAEIIFSIDNTKSVQINIGYFIETISSVTYTKIFGIILKSISLIWIVRLIGKKVF